MADSYTVDATSGKLTGTARMRPDGTEQTVFAAPWRAALDVAVDLSPWAGISDPSLDAVLRLYVRAGDAEILAQEVPYAAIASSTQPAQGWALRHRGGGDQYRLTIQSAEDERSKPEIIVGYVGHGFAPAPHEPADHVTNRAPQLLARTAFGEIGGAYLTDGYMRLFTRATRSRARVAYVRQAWGTLLAAGAPVWMLLVNAYDDLSSPQILDRFRLENPGDVYNFDFRDVNPRVDNDGVPFYAVDGGAAFIVASSTDNAVTPDLTARVTCRAETRGL